MRVVTARVARHPAAMLAGGAIIMKAAMADGIGPRGAFALPIFMHSL